MRERSPQDVAWNEQKGINAEHNRLLADNVLYHGRFIRRTITAARALRAILRPKPVDTYYSLKHRAEIKVERHPQEGGDFAV